MTSKARVPMVPDRAKVGPVCAAAAPAHKASSKAARRDDISRESC